MPKPGEWILSDEPVEINPGRRSLKLKVRNIGDRPIQVGSHFHFFEVNRALDFDREQAIGMHLNVPGGMAVRFEPGDEREVELVEFGGTKRIVGFNNLMDGGMTARWSVSRALGRARALGFLGMGETQDAAAIVRSEGGEDQGGHPSSRSHRKQPEQSGKGGSRKGRK